MAPSYPAFAVPYAPAVVELDEGFFMISAVVGCEPEDLFSGMRLSVEFHDASDEIALAYFSPAAGAMSVTAVVIRPVAQDDWNGWKKLWDGYLDFYREQLDEATSRFTFDRLCRPRGPDVRIRRRSDGQLTASRMRSCTPLRGRPRATATWRTCS